MSLQYIRADMIFMGEILIGDNTCWYTDLCKNVIQFLKKKVDMRNIYSTAENKLPRHNIFFLHKE